jgi:chromosome segregation ATPase
MGYVPDNYAAYRQYERDQERDEFYNDKLSGLEEAIGQVIDICDDIDVEDNKDMADRFEKIREILEKVNV